jgi:hypothetical protein
MLRATAIQQIGEIARIDLSRDIRKGFPEIILAEGKTSEDVIKIALNVLNEKGRVIISRVNKDLIENITKSVPINAIFNINEKARIITIKDKDFKIPKTGGRIGILTAGTSDIPVAEEAKTIAEEMGCEVLTAYDVGVAGLHRLFEPLREMIEADVDVLVVVAGREGALPTLVAGLVDMPIVAVPTSSGYGYGGGGTSALMAMLQACPLGMAVVNIDSGVAAGTIAALIANRAARFRETTP